MKQHWLIVQKTCYLNTTTFEIVHLHTNIFKKNALRYVYGCSRLRSPVHLNFWVGNPRKACGGSDTWPFFGLPSWGQIKAPENITIFGLFFWQKPGTACLALNKIIIILLTCSQIQSRPIHWALNNQTLLLDRQLLSTVGGFSSHQQKKVAPLQWFCQNSCCLGPFFGSQYERVFDVPPTLAHLRELCLLQRKNIANMYRNILY